MIIFQIYVNKLCSINLVGLRIEAPFLKEMLEKLEIKIDPFKRRNYKNAINTLTEDKFDEYHREAT